MTAVGTYQPHPSDVSIVPQILVEVEMVHEFKNKGEWVITSGIQSDKRYHIFVAGKTSARRCFFVQPLQAAISERDTVVTSVTHRVNR